MHKAVFVAVALLVPQVVWACQKAGRTAAKLARGQEWDANLQDWVTR